MKDTLIAIERLIEVAEQVLVMHPEDRVDGVFKYQLDHAIKKGRSILGYGKLLNLRLSNKDYFGIVSGEKRYKVIRPNQYNKNRFFNNDKPINYKQVNIYTTKGGEKLHASYSFNRAVILKHDSEMKGSRKGDYLIRFGEAL